ncbi:MAG: prepilin peptidase [Nanoarchaeota archaeon]
MIIDFILVAIGFCGILIGTITDIQKREVADWLNFMLMISGFMLRLFFSITSGDWMMFVWGVAGFAIAFGIANLMFYTGQWGGGDAKMIMGLGLLFATYRLPQVITADTSITINTPLVFFGLFFLYSMLSGAFLGAGYSIYKALQHRKKFRKEWNKLTATRTFMFGRYGVFAALVALVVLAFVVPDISLRLPLFTLGLLLMLALYGMTFVRAVEKGCMIDQVHPDDLVEGDWIVHDIRLQGKHIVGPKDLGIDEEQIKILRQAQRDGDIGQIAVKVGMPLVPAFLIGFIITVVIGTSLFSVLF